MINHAICAVLRTWLNARINRQIFISLYKGNEAENVEGILKMILDVFNMRIIYILSEWEEEKNSAINCMSSTKKIHHSQEHIDVTLRK